MKTIIAIFFALHLHVLSFSQILYGIVIDKQTGDTINYASVYFNGTFIGQNTDAHGRFAIDLAGNRFMPLTVSAIGYYSVTITEFPKVAILKVLLEPKVYEVKEVVINAQSLLRERERNMGIFRREFLGNSIYATRCQILNEKDITFNYGTDNDTLKAYARNVIRIHNPLLGYNMACYLDQFEFCRKTDEVKFTGYVLFQQDLIDSSDINKIKKRRRHAYLGSPMHFFRSLWNNTLMQEKFGGYDSVKYIKGKSLYKKIVIDTDSIKYLHDPGYFGISYSGKLTDLIFKADSVAFNKRGQYDYTGLMWQGEMGKVRVGDWLPLEYEP